ncbi:ABC transporter ATP-binding protein/permease [Jonesia quinghaiensis]|uniref:ABC transporter ATP-binding protein/permease n=1 Tax=Jonesia quinghaiensis TaxID=262806 RepID=UPI00042044AA|nr:ABC transporter ATP-binding protein [Jonesia quinghaiensis]
MTAPHTPPLYSPRATTILRASIALTSTAALAAALLMVCIGALIDAYLTTSVIAVPLVAVAAGCAGLSAALTALTIVITGQGAAREEQGLRATLMNHVLRLGPTDRSEPNKHSDTGNQQGTDRTGALTSMMTDGAERAATYRLTFLGPTIAAMTSPLVVLVVIAVSIDVVAALILLALVPLIPGLIGGFRRAFGAVSSRSRDQRQRLAADYLDALQGLNTLQFVGAAGWMHRKLAAAGEVNRRTIMRLLAVNQVVIFLTDALFSLGMVTVAAALAMIRFNSGDITAGQAVALVLLSLLLLEPMNKVGEFFYVGMGGMAAERGMKRFLALQPHISDNDDASAGIGSPGAGSAHNGGVGRGESAAPVPAVNLNALNFSYGDTPVLSDVSLAVQPGEHVAITGRTGAGKSTLLKVLQRHVPTDPGAVMIHGTDVTSMTARQGRARTATVNQSTFLFTASVRDNLLIAHPQADDNALWKALSQANIAADIRAMPHGLDTIIGERGHGLSGGQAQRIAIARALLTGADILILDEPTAHVDLAGEQLILEALRNIPSHHTVLTVAHRPTLIAAADRVLHLDNGTLTEVTS